MNKSKNLSAATPDDTWERGALHMMIVSLHQLVNLSAEIDKLMQSIAALTEKYPPRPAEQTPDSSSLPEDTQP